MPEYHDEILALGSGVRATPQEISIAVSLTTGEPNETELRRVLGELEFLSAHAWRFKKAGPAPTEAIFSIARKLSERTWAQHVFVSLLSFRWGGIEELAIAKRIVQGEIERMKGAAA